MTFPLGLVIGKFLPPHQGHQYLIEFALAQSDHVIVIVCERDEDPIPGSLRELWLSEIAPKAELLRIEDHYDPKDSQLWARLVVGWLGRSPDVVFTSEDYGDLFAHYLGCRHVLVDRARTVIPCSGTAIRNDPYAAWEYLPEPVRGYYARRICVLGAESTGTTTLSEMLARHLQTRWVPEYGREYTYLKIDRGETEWCSDEFVTIAEEQTRQENAAARLANRLLICDTNAFATCLWHRRYMGFDSSQVARMAAEAPADLYILTGDEIPFVQDGIRDGEQIRHEMQEWFRSELKLGTTPWLEVHGTPSERLMQAISAIDHLFADSKWRPLRVSMPAD